MSPHARAVSVLLVVGVFALVNVNAVQPLEICLGVVLPVTGPRNIESLRIIETLKLAAEDVTRDPDWMPGTILHVIPNKNSIDAGGYVVDTARKMYDQIVSEKCENGTSPIVVIGGMRDAVVAQMSTVANILSVPVVTPGVRASQFSLDYINNPLVVMMRPGLQDEANALLAVFKAMGWNQVVLWHSNSEFGGALTNTFTASGIEMLDVPIPADDSGVEAAKAIVRIMTLRFRVIVVHAEPELARLMMNLSYRSGMLNGDYLFFGSSAWTYGTDLGPASFNEMERGYLQGVVGLSMVMPAAPMAVFAQRLAKRSPKLYPPNYDEAPLDTRIAAYDSVRALALAVKNLTLAGLSYTGQNLVAAMTSADVDFTGAIGNRIHFDAVKGNIISSYTLTNFQNGRFVTVGSWALDSGLAWTAPIVWPGMNAEANPSQLVPRRLLVPSSILPVVGVLLGVLYALMSLLLHYLIYINHNHEVIKASSPIFCHIILCGGDTAYVMSGLSALGQESTCLLVPAMISLCFSLVFGALTAKTYRIHRIFNSAELRIKTPTNLHLFVICGALVGYDLLVLALWAGTDMPHAAFLHTPNDPTTSYLSCAMNSAMSWAMALFIPKVVLVVYGAYLAYKVRDLNHNFNEAKYISLALYNVLVLASLSYGLVAAFPYGVDVVFAVKTFGSATIAFITMLILFAPKFWDVYITRDWVDYHSNSSYVSGVLVHKSSKGSYVQKVSAHTHTATTTGTTTGADRNAAVRVRPAATATATDKPDNANAKPTVAIGQLTGTGAGTSAGTGAGTGASTGAGTGARSHAHARSSPHAQHHRSGNGSDQKRDVFVSGKSGRSRSPVLNGSPLSAKKSGPGASSGANPGVSTVVSAAGTTVAAAVAQAQVQPQASPVSESSLLSSQSSSMSSSASVAVAAAADVGAVRPSVQAQVHPPMLTTNRLTRSSGTDGSVTVNIDSGIPLSVLSTPSVMPMSVATPSATAAAAAGLGAITSAGAGASVRAGDDPVVSGFAAVSSPSNAFLIPLQSTRQSLTVNPPLSLPLPQPMSLAIDSYARAGPGASTGAAPPGTGISSVALSNGESAGAAAGTGVDVRAPGSTAAGDSL